MNPTSVNFRIESLDKRHNREVFRCGNEKLGRYFQVTITQDQSRNIAIPYVAFDLERQKIVGYYTLSMSSIDLGELPNSVAKKLPKYPLIGVTLIGRLAVDLDYKGYGWGKLLLMDALYRSFEVSKQVASFAAIVDAIDEGAVSFYQRFEFQAFPDQPYKLFRTMKNVAQTFA